MVQETAGGGGTTHSVSITESVGVTSSVAAQAILSGALTESIGATDSISAVATKLAQATEPIGIADAANGGVIASVGAASESIGASDSSDASVVTGGTVHSVSITEAVGIASSASALVIANATITEAIGIAAAQGATAVIVAQITEAVGITATQNALVPGGALGAPLVQGIRSLTKDAAVNVMVLMVDSADHITALSGLSLSCELSKDGGAFSAISPSVTEAGNGWYRVQLTATDTDTYGDLVLHVTASGADPSDVVSQVRDIAQEVLTAATVAPIAANIKQVNAVTITGGGIETTDEWRPA